MLSLVPYSLPVVSRPTNIDCKTFSVEVVSRIPLIRYKNIWWFTDKSIDLAALLIILYK